MVKLASFFFGGNGGGATVKTIFLANARRGLIFYLICQVDRHDRFDHVEIVAMIK